MFQKTKSIHKKKTLRDALQIVKMLSNAEDFINYHVPTEIAELRKMHTQL